ncbi:MAG: DUF3786 domain-containing protein [Spirochaetaceae bacterium]|jgi:hypothetical protein|nr:DUF3786 domain-containing protein [Spirochaetaceae bacterium]
MTSAAPLPDKRRADWKETGIEHFSRIYRELDAGEIAARCKLPFSGGTFSLRLMGQEYMAGFPVFTLEAADGGGEAALAVRALVLRYLCQGRWARAAGRRLSYREVPWGETYFANFEGRCIKRLAALAGDPEGFCRFFEHTPALRAEKLPTQLGYRFEFLSDLFFTFILWPGDDEFPAQAQILFDDNIPAAFTAEDLAVAGDIAIGTLKKAMAGF